jgi:hypothetical protein
MLTLLNETAGLAADLLEKNGCIVPFCKVRTLTQESIYIQADDNDNGTPYSDDDLQRCADSIWVELKRRIASGVVLEFAFCSDSIVKFQNDPEHQRVLKVNFQNGSDESAVYFFPLSVENGKVQLAPKYLLSDLPEKLL